MRCLITAGPSYEPVDQVRRLTNFSTGQLGTELAEFLEAHGHTVVLLRSRQSTFRAYGGQGELIEFDTSDALKERFEALAGSGVGAVFHAAAVGDFRCGGAWERLATGEMRRLNGGKISSGGNSVWLELIPAPKLISRLREWFPKAQLTGWKYEIDGGHDAALERGRRQIQDNRTDACIVNGPAYGAGFGLIRRGAMEHCSGSQELFRALAGMIGSA